MNEDSLMVRAQRFVEEFNAALSKMERATTRADEMGEPWATMLRESMPHIWQLKRSAMLDDNRDILLACVGRIAKQGDLLSKVTEPGEFSITVEHE